VSNEPFFLCAVTSSAQPISGSQLRVDMGDSIGRALRSQAFDAGVRAATLFWPGSEVEIRGRRPSDRTA
jgi:hypothetical protein